LQQRSTHECYWKGESQNSGLAAFLGVEMLFKWIQHGGGEMMDVTWVSRKGTITASIHVSRFHHRRSCWPNLHKKEPRTNPYPKPVLRLTYQVLVLHTAAPIAAFPNTSPFYWKTSRQHICLQLLSVPFSLCKKPSCTIFKPLIALVGNLKVTTRSLHCSTLFSLSEQQIIRLRSHPCTPLLLSRPSTLPSRISTRHTAQRNIDKRHRMPNAGC
jgi:hypothetical protein